MQIHEITQRPLKEGALSTIAGSVVKGIGGALDQHLGIKGADLAPANMGGGGADQLAAFKANSGLVQSITTAMQKAWGETVATQLAQTKDSATGAPFTSVKQMDAASQGLLKKSLISLINKTIRPSAASFDYETMGRGSDNPDIVGAAYEIKDSITRDMELVWTMTTDGAKSSEIAPAWKNLVNNGIAPAQNFLTYNTEKRTSKLYRDPTSGQFMIDLGSGPEKLDLTNPEHKAVHQEWMKGTG